MGLIIIVNSVLFALVIRGLGCGTGSGLQSNQSKGKIARLKVNAAVGCFVLLGKLTCYRPIERRRQSRFCLVILILKFSINVMRLSLFFLLLFFVHNCNSRTQTNSQSISSIYTTSFTLSGVERLQVHRYRYMTSRHLVFQVYRGYSVSWL